MKNFFLKSLILFLPFAALQAQEEESVDDQFEVLFGTSGYVLYRVLDFANDHGYRYIKILSYEFNGFDHVTSFVCNANQIQGRIFEIKDQYATISFLCFEEPPLMDRYFIDLEKYQHVIGVIQEEVESHLEE